MKDSKPDAASSGSVLSTEGDAIKVFLRVRPPEHSISGGAMPITGRAVEVNAGSNSVTLLAKPDPKVFTFDHVADVHSTQESIFSAVGKSLIESCVAGYNGTIFAYGQTGSGKTFTMLGPSEECDNFKHELRGVIPRSFEHLFNLINREHELHGERKQFLCKCSFLEIYQEQVYDLLDPAAANLQLRENIKKGVFVDGLMEQVVATPTEAYQALSIGWLNRRVASTSMNRESSRSHAVFTLFIESKEEKNGVKNVRESQLNLVDLAGSERQKDTNTLGIRLKEAGKINQSLSVLGNVIMSLVKIAQGKTQHIPYRDSKLTFLLRDSLGGNARTSIVACIHPDSKCFGETLSTLNFAKRAKQIKNKAVINEDTQGNVAHLQCEIRRLREMLGQFQAGAAVARPLCTEGADGQESSSANHMMGGDAGTVGEWRSKFFEAMLFREKCEQEKENLHHQLKSLEEEGRKKDRVVQSSRLIVKFKESTITRLEKAAKNAGTPPPEDGALSVTPKMVQDLASLKAQLDEFPKVSQMDQQLHGLRAQLADARIRLSGANVTVLDSNRLMELEQAFRELQAAHRRESTIGVVGSPHSGGDSRSTSASLMKMREKVEALEQENEQLKKQMTEERQTWESKEAKLQAEVKAMKKMTSDLERLLEANHLKHRIQHDALTNLHCQTIKALTPTRNSYDLRNRVILCKTDVSALNLDQSIEMEKGGEGEEDICQEAPPPDMVDNAHEVLTEEIKALQQSNSSMQERLNEYEADMLRLKQQTTQLELEKDSIAELLSKERQESAEKLAEQEKSVRDMKTTVEALRVDVKYAKEEAQDYQLLLHSSDKELKQEKDKVKAHSSASDQKINVLETQLLKVQCVMETVNKQLEEETKEREGMEEKLEMERMEKMFLQEQVNTMETTITSLNKEHEAVKGKLKEAEARLEAVKQEQQQRLQERSQQIGEQEEKHQVEVCDLRNKLGDLTKDCDEKRRQLDAMATELEVTKFTCDSLRREVADNCGALQQQVQRVQELKGRLQESEDRCSVLEDLAQSRSAETTDAKDQVERLEALLRDKSIEIDAANVDREMLTEDLSYYQKEHEKTVLECESLRQNIESLEESKETLQSEIQSLKAEVGERDQRLQQITLHLEEVQASQRVAAPSVGGGSNNSNNTSIGALTSTPLTSPERPSDAHITSFHENKLAAMVEELTQGRDQWMEENQQLKSRLEVLHGEAADKEALSQQCQDLQCQLDNQNAVFKESIQQLQEVNSMEQKETHMLRESLMEAQRQQEALDREKQQLTAQFEEAQSERQHAEEELHRLKSVVEKSYRERDQLQSTIEAIRDEHRKTEEELRSTDRRCQELREDNAVLAGHANHSQKLSYMKRVQEDYDLLKKRYEEVTKENDSLRKRLPSSPLKDRTNTSSAVAADPVV